MADMISIDASEAGVLAADMRAVDSRLTRWVGPVIEKGANNIKKELQAEMRTSSSFGVVAPGISYDLTSSGSSFEAEVGPVKGSPGSLANIAYFGGSRGGGGTVADPQGALDSEAPRFADALADLAADLVFG